METKNRGFGDRCATRFAPVVGETSSGREDLPPMRTKRRPRLAVAQTCFKCRVVMAKGSRLVKWDKRRNAWRHAACPPEHRRNTA